LKYDKYDKIEIIKYYSQTIHLVTYWKTRVKIIKHKQFYNGFTLYTFTTTEHFDVNTPKYNAT